MVYVSLYDHEHVYVQVIYQVITVMIQLVYLIHFRPYKEPEPQALDVFNELTTLGLSYFIMCFSNANPIEGGTESFDWYFILILGGNISTHLLLIIWGQGYILKLKCKRSYEMRKLKNRSFKY